MKDIKRKSIKFVPNAPVEPKTKRKNIGGCHGQHTHAQSEQEGLDENGFQFYESIRHFRHEYTNAYVQYC